MNINIIVAPVEQYLLTSRLARNRRKEGSVAVRRRKAFISRVEHSLSHGAVRIVRLPKSMQSDNLHQGVQSNENRDAMGVWPQVMQRGLS